MKLAKSILVDPVEVAVAPVSTTAEKVTQWVLLVDAPTSARCWPRCCVTRR